MMKERSRNLVVGVTALIALLGLGFMFMLFGNAMSLVEEAYEVTVNMPNAAGLNSGSSVQLDGIPIGRVEEVALQPTPMTGVRLRLKIDQKIDLPSNVDVKVNPKLVGGTVSLEMHRPAEPAATIAKDGSAVLQGEIGSMATQLAESLKGTLGGPMDQLEKLSTQFQSLSDEWRLVGKNLNQLLEPRTTAMVDGEGGVPTTQPNLSTLLERTDERMRELKVTMANINKWTGDEQLLADFKATASNAKEASGKLNAGVDKITGLADSSRENVDRLTKRLMGVADDLSKTIGSMQQTLDQAREGEGTVGKLINDPALYDNLNDTAQRLGSAATELQLLIQKWKAEGLPVKF
jgi:phospholipid/cholesterol/gamma-HCH transport system substrate-binding protein